MHRTIITFLFAGALGTAATAAPVKVDFEAFAQNAQVNSLSIGSATATVTTVGAPEDARIFDTTNPNVNDLDLASPFASADGGDALSPGKILVGGGNGPGEAPNDDVGHTITFTFDQLVAISGITLFDIEEEVTLSADGVQFFSGDTRVNGSGGDGLYRVFNFAPKVLSELAITNTGSGGYDDLMIAPVPVPAALPMLAAAFGGLALLRRRKR